VADWKAAAEAEARPVEPEHPWLFPLQVDAESQKRTDRYNFRARFFSEAKQSGYQFSYSESFRRVTQVEDARDEHNQDVRRAENVQSEVDAMVVLEVDDYYGSTYASLLSKRRNGQSLSGGEKRYLSMGEIIRKLGFLAVTEMDRVHALALWGCPSLANQVLDLWKFEEGRTEPATVKGNVSFISSYARDQAISKLLPMLKLTSLGQSTTYHESLELPTADRLVLCELVLRFPGTFKKALQEEDVDLRKARGEKSPIAHESPLVPNPCRVRLALQCANVLLKNMGVRLETINTQRSFKFAQDSDYNPTIQMDADADELLDAAQLAARGRPRRGKPVAFYKLQSSENIHLMYAILALSPKVSAKVKAKIRGFPLPVNAEAGMILVRKKASLSKKKLSKLEEISQRVSRGSSRAREAAGGIQ